MSERERWIVYPLIFFALGAAIRDKLIQRVETKEVVCESLRVVDSRDPYRTLAELTFDRVRSNDPNSPSVNAAELFLADSEGNMLCSIDEKLYVASMETGTLGVIDPHQDILVRVATEPAEQPDNGEATEQAKLHYQGVIYLNNERLRTGLRVAPEPLESGATKELPSAPAPEE